MGTTALLPGTKDGLLTYKWVAINDGCAGEGKCFDCHIVVKCTDLFLVDIRPWEGWG